MPAEVLKNVLRLNDFDLEPLIQKWLLEHLITVRACIHEVLVNGRLDEFRLNIAPA